MKDLLCILLFLFLSFIVVGCKNRKEIISFENNNLQFSIVGYAKSAPFSPEPNFYCFLEVPQSDFRSDQIVYMLVFNELNNGLCAIYENTDGQKFLMRGLHKKDTDKISSIEEVFLIDMKIGKLDNFNFEILGRNIVINEVKCVLINWHSGGIKFFSFEDFREGVVGSLSYNIEGKYDLSKSGKVIFTDWTKNSDSWPSIKEIHFPLK